MALRGCGFGSVAQQNCGLVVSRQLRRCIRWKRIVPFGRHADRFAVETLEPPALAASTFA